MSRRRLGTILAHEWRLIARDPLPVMVLIVFPIITMAFVKPAFRAALQQTGYPHANGAEQVVPGQAVMNAFFIVSLTTFAFFSEYSFKTWDRLRASPATSPEIPRPLQKNATRRRCGWCCARRRCSPAHRRPADLLY